MFDFSLPLDKTPSSTAKKVPSLQKQLIARLQQAILRGDLPAGANLMPSRLLAQELNVSRNTIVNAYEHLLAEGYVVTDSSGTRVAPRIALLNRPSTEETLHYQMPSRLSHSLNTRTPLTPDMLLAPGMPALKEFPLVAWRRSLERACQAMNFSQLGENHPLGEPRLRQALAQHLYLARGVNCQPEQIVITEGSKQALELCITLFTETGDHIWVEDPGYRAASSAFHAADLVVHPLPVDQQGITVPESAWQEFPPSLIYTTPAHQYPSGSVLAMTRRLALLQQVREHGGWIIEDDYDGEFRHQGEPIASLQGIVSDSPVVYMGSFSKTLFPTLRLGFIVLPPTVLRHTQRVLHEIFRSSNRLQQLAVADFILKGEFARHLSRMRRLYRQRQQVLRQALAYHFPNHAILGGQSGMHLTLKLDPLSDDTAIAHAAHQQQLGVRAYSHYFQQPENRQSGVVIGYGNTPAEEIPGAVVRLVKIIHSLA